MLRNYLTIAWRSLLKNRLTTFINIGGLVIGIGGSLLIGLFVLDELSYDQHFDNSERIYRATTTHVKEGIVYHSAQTNGGIAADLLQQFPEIQHATRLLPEDEVFLFTKETAFKEKIIYTDSSFLNVFDIHLRSGNRHNCLSTPSSIIISETTALKLFGNNWSEQSILGETLAIDGRIPLIITGVFTDFPEQSHFTSHLFASVPSGYGNWLSDKSKVYTYVLLATHHKPDELDRKIKTTRLNTTDENRMEQISLQPVTRIHLFSSFEDENARLGNIKNIYALLLVSLFLIVITVSNFINLYTASSLNRLKEVGVRKALGALSKQLRTQFLIETSLITLIALSVALLIVVAILPVFNELTGKGLSPASLLNSTILQFVAILSLSISLLSGFYPSVYLSRFKSIEALKGVKKKVSPIMIWRKGLVVLQFSVSAIMITLSIVALQQVNLIQNKSLGFDKENIITLANPYMLGSTEKIVALKNELLTVPGVEQISITGYTPSQNRWGNQKITFPDRNENSIHAQPATWLTVDEGFITTMGLTLIAGRDFLDNHEHDREAIIINEKATDQFNLNNNGKNPVGAELSVKNDAEPINQNYTVVGIVKDFHFGSLHDKVKPIIMKVGYHRFEMALRLATGHLQDKTLSRIEGIWKMNLPLIPFEYSFIKDRFERLHKSDIVSSKIFTAFCLVTVFISALGLFSIVTYTITNRTKEIGIRKTLGASEKSIALLLSGEFLMVILISYILALPFSWLLTNRWISDFAYRTEISLWVYSITGFTLIVITSSTLGYQSIKAACTNPINQLRYE